MKYLGISIINIITFRLLSYAIIVKYYLKYVLPNVGIVIKTKKLRNISRGKNAIVIAGGPSVSKLDPYKIVAYQNEGYEVISLNSFVSSDLFDIVKPNHYVMSDPGHFGCNPNLTNEQKSNFESEVKQVTEKDITLFLPVEFYNRVPYANKYAFIDAENIFSSNASNILMPRGYVSSTAYKALAVACFMGYDTIYICGFDCDYFKSFQVDIDNKLYFDDVHFYDKDVNRRYVAPYIVGWGDGSVAQALYIIQLWIHQLSKFASNNIVNLDPNGIVSYFTKQHNLDIYKD